MKFMDLDYRFVLGRILAMSNLRGVRDRTRINRSCIGYSGALHWHFFRRFIRRHNPGSVLMLGVYYGRDIAYIRHFSPGCTIVGVDKFDSSLGTDWAPETLGMTWEQAGQGRAPALELTLQNFKALGNDAELVKGTAEEYLKETRRTFDFIYVDIAHDYATTKQTIELSLPRLNRGGVLAGDDYGTSGVRRAVDEFFPDRKVIGYCIWHTEPRI